MTELTAPKKKRTALQLFGRVLLWICLCLFLLALLGVLPIGLVLEFGVLVLVGWLEYLIQVLPRVRFNAEIALDAAIALALAVFGLHRILRWWTRKQRGESAMWRFSWTARITAMALLLFATSIAATGIAHQVGWLFRAETLVSDANRGILSRELSHAKQVAIGLRLFADDHDGKLPAELFELFPDYLVEHQVFFSASSNEPSEQFLYFPDDRAPNFDETVIVASPRPAGSGKRAVARRDGSASVMKESDFQELLLKQSPANQVEVAVP
jgi:hypothetical protein